MKKYEHFDLESNVEFSVHPNTEENCVKFVFDIDQKRFISIELSYEEALEICGRLKKSIDRINNEIANQR